MRKMRCLFLAALLAVATAVAVPAVAASAPAGPDVWSIWWQEVSAWITRLSPFGEKAVAASNDTITSADDDGSAPTADADPGLVYVEPDSGQNNETGPGIDPDG